MLFKCLTGSLLAIRQILIPLGLHMTPSLQRYMPALEQSERISRFEPDQASKAVYIAGMAACLFRPLFENTEQQHSEIDVLKAFKA